MQEIADLLGVSKVSVSKMLQSGRELGLVKIQIVPPGHLTYTEIGTPNRAGSTMIRARSYPRRPNRLRNLVRQWLWQM